jgi:chemotaxis signal transduction protein/chemotaxis regulatin CheY-phosphate phosphatase CheZ
VKSSDTQQVLSFHIGEVECAVELAFVREVLRFTEVTRLPGCDSAVLGTIHRHDGFLPIVDLHRQFGSAMRTPDERTRILILEVAGHGVGVLVDALGEILPVASQTLQPLPAWMSAAYAPSLQGFYGVAGRWLLMLAPSRLWPEEAMAPAASAWANVSPTDAVEPSESAEAAHPKRSWRAKVPRQTQKAPDPEVKLQSSLDAQSLKELEDMAKAMSEGDFHRQVSSKIQGELENLATYISKTMSNLQLLDPSVRISAERDIPSASQQLSEVVKSTEEATNTIISLTETLMDHQAALGKAIEKLKRSKYRNCKHLEIIEQIERLHWEDEKTLMEIITNLSFQDLTGQRINKIVTMVATVQAKLCDLIRAFGLSVRVPEAEPAAEPSPEPSAEETGKLAQDSVDSLLNQLFT